MRVVLAILKLLTYIVLSSTLLAISTAAAGWLTWEALLYLIRHSK